MSEPQFGPVATRDELLGDLAKVHKPNSTANVGERMAAALLAMTPGEMTAVTHHVDEMSEDEADQMLDTLADAAANLQARADMVKTALCRLVASAEARDGHE